MRKRTAAALLALCLMLSGCSEYMRGSYVSVSPHLEEDTPEEQETIRATSLEELRDALTTMIDSCATGGTITVADYTVGQDPADGMRSAIQYAMNTYPLGAYAVQDIEFEEGYSGGLDAFAVTITYRRTEAEVDRIQWVRNDSSACTCIYTALDDCEASVTMKIEQYQQTDFTQVVEDYAAEHPELVMETPQVSVSFYPDSGSTRIVELKFTYENSRESLRSMQDQVQLMFDAAKLYVSGGEDDRQKLTQLYAFLMERYDYQISTSITPAYSLLCHGVGDSKAFAGVFAAMCRNAGLTCYSVPGTRDGEPWTWNIVQDGDTWYHVDLLRCAQTGGFQELVDQDMLGYVWDYSAFPACVAPEEPEDTTPDDSSDDLLLPDDSGETEPQETSPDVTEDDDQPGETEPQETEQSLEETP